MKIDEKEMRLLVEEYSYNVAKLETAASQLMKSNKYNTKITAAYGLNSGGGGNSFNSKVENKVIEIIEIENNFREYKGKTEIVEIAENILTKDERKVIEFMKIGFSKISTIAQLMSKKKKYIFDTRNRAIKKMSEYYGGCR